MLHENVHVPYKNSVANPRISPKTITDTTEIRSSGQVSSSKDVTDFYINNFIHLAINASINKNEFTSLLKLAYVIPVLKKGSKNPKHSYKPIRLKTSKTFLKNMKELCLNK